MRHRNKHSHNKMSGEETVLLKITNKDRGLKGRLEKRLHMPKKNHKKFQKIYPNHLVLRLRVLKYKRRNKTSQTSLRS